MEVGRKKFEKPSWKKKSISVVVHSACRYIIYSKYKFLLIVDEIF